MKTLDAVARELHPFVLTCIAYTYRDGILYVR